METVASFSALAAGIMIGLGALAFFGCLEGQSLTFAVGAALVFSALALAVSALWRRRFSRGPLETVMRRMSS